MASGEFDPAGFGRALASLDAALDRAVKAGLGLTLERIAARAKQTTTFTDRTSALRNSMMSEGVQGSFGGELFGEVGFAATSPKGYFYGLALEFGTRRGIAARRFMRDAIEAEDGALIEDAMASAFSSLGFQVTR